MRDALERREEPLDLGPAQHERQLPGDRREGQLHHPLALPQGRAVQEPQRRRALVSRRRRQASLPRQQQQVALHLIETQLANWRQSCSKCSPNLRTWRT